MSIFSQVENKQLELKKEYTKNILKTVSAFSNYHDGEIVIGVDDSREVTGVEKPAALKLSLENAINDNIIPRPYYEISEEAIEGKTIVRIKVYSGENTPYMYSNKAYKRMDTSTIGVQRHDLEALILKGRNQGYDELPALYGNLKFEGLNKKLKSKLNLGSVSEDILKTLGLIANEKYNNGAALLSDENPTGTGGLCLIRFENNSVSQIKDRLILENVSILEMFDKSIEFYHKHINKREVIKNAYRKTIEEIPLVSYREAVANAIVHRDYLYNMDIRVEIYDNRIEIISPGGLPIGITEEEYLEGRVSIRRNKIIADVFARLGIIEKLATGIRRIKEYYKDYQNKPEFIVLENSITVILPNISDEIDQTKRAPVENERMVGKTEGMASENEPMVGKTEGRVGETERIAVETKGRILSSEEERIMSYAEHKGKITRLEVESLLSLKKTHAVAYLNKLIDKGLLLRIGGGRNTYYTLGHKQKS